MWLTLILCRAGIRDKLNLIETESLSLELRSGSEDDKTAAIDSTKKKRAGTFGTKGNHIGQNVPFPLPIISIYMW